MIDLSNTYRLLRRGRDSEVGSRSFPHGNITILIGYGLDAFKLQGVRVRAPRDLTLGQFMPSRKGGVILEGSGIKYANWSPQNLGLSACVIIQIISKSQLATYRAVQETWQTLARDRRTSPVYLSGFFTGFQRDDNRGWLGFHDESSNLKSVDERKKVITINRMNNNLQPQDLWSEGGTYLAFLRINIDLGTWNRLELKKQELIVGRNKLTGRPLVGINNKGDPISQSRIGRSGNAMLPFGDHPDYFAMSRTSHMEKNSAMRESIRILNQSHIGRVRHIESISSKLPASRRIFRQSFHFIEPSSVRDNPVNVGLNFVSFQNDPARLLFILTDAQWMGKSNFGGNPSDPGTDKLISVDASGIFYVPPDAKPFPGANIFSNS